MTHTVPLFIAANNSGLYFVGMMLVIWLLGALGKAMSKKPTTPGARPSGGAPTGRASLEELATQRRQQLDRLARERRAVMGNQPANLTMDEMRQRVAAKAEYERRAAMLRQRAAAPPGTPGRSAPRPPAVAAPAPTLPPARRATGMQEQLEAQRRIQRAAQRASTPQRTVSTQGAPSSAGVSTRMVEQATAEIAGGADDEERQASAEVGGSPPIAAVVTPTPRAAVTINGATLKLTARSMQAAIVLSELLGRPVALRDPMAHPYAGA